MYFQKNFNRNIVLMYTISLLQGMVFYGSVSTLYRQAVGVTLFQITLMESLSMVLTIVLEIPWGILADKIGYKRTFVICSFLFFVSKLIFWRADSFADFLTERILLAAVISGLSGVDTSILYLSVKGEDTQRIFGFYNTMSVAGLFLASGMYSLFIGKDYRMAGLLTAVSYGIAAFLSLWLTEVREEQKKTERKNSWQIFCQTLPELFGKRNAAAFLVSMALVSEVHQMITVVLNQPQFQKCGATDRQIGLLFLLLTVCEMTGGLSARITGRIGEKAMFFGAFLIPGICCLILTGTDRLAVSALAVMLIQISFCLLQPLQTEIQNRMVVPGHRAAMLSVYAVFMDGTAAVVDLLFGKAADFHLPLAMLLGALACTLGLFLYCWGNPKKNTI
ncbi:MAG TPA: MFS transporter [Candidatus Blautia stercoravium]|nr:MFS transporter [Candidatus Blautia stercoravium]